MVAYWRLVCAAEIRSILLIFNGWRVGRAEYPENVPNSQTSTFNLLGVHHLIPFRSLPLLVAILQSRRIPIAVALMASKKDMRRPDLIVPYVEPAKDKSDGDMTSTMASTLPMAAIFTRNKMIGWTAVVFALQSWLAETPEQKRTATTPGYFSVGMAFMSLMVAYLPMFLPPPPNQAGVGPGTEAPAAVPP